MNLYDVYIKVSEGVFEPAPNPPPPEWRERKGYCKKCGEIVYVKAGPERTFWTHGMGKTCVPKPNSVADTVAAAEYEKNKGALTEGNDRLKAQFDAAMSAQQEEHNLISPACSEPVRESRLWRQRTYTPELRLESAAPLTNHRDSISEAVSLGWVEAELVLSGRLSELKDIEAMPPPGTSGTVAIHYQTDFTSDKYERHAKHAVEKYPGVSLPSYEDVSRNRRSFYWGVADYVINEVSGRRIMSVSNVGLLPTHMFQISEGRRFWTLSDSDSQMVYRSI